MKKNTKARNRRSQATKGGENRAMSNAMQGKRFSNAAGPHRAETDYRRKPKHFKGWDD